MVRHAPSFRTNEGTAKERKTKMDEKKMAAIAVDVTSDATGADGSVTRETSRYVCAVAHYPKEQLDFGNYLSLGEFSSVYVYDADGREVCMDLEEMYDRIAGGQCREISSAARECVQALKFGGTWFEKDVKDGRRSVVRATALDALPELSLENTLKYGGKGDLNELQLMEIRINGSPMMAGGSLIRGNTIVRDIASELSEHYTRRLHEAGFEDATAVLLLSQSFLADTGDDESRPYVGLRIFAPTDERLREAVGKTFGVPNAGSLEIFSREGFVSEGTSRSMAVLTIEM